MFSLGFRVRVGNVEDLIVSEVDISGIDKVLVVSITISEWAFANTIVLLNFIPDRLPVRSRLIHVIVKLRELSKLLEMKRHDSSLD